MFQIIPTKNYAGFELRGDSGDFRSLLSAIYYLDNEEYLRAAGYHDVMNYFFTLAFEARYALDAGASSVRTMVPASGISQAEQGHIPRFRRKTFIMPSGFQPSACCFMRLRRMK